MTSCSCNSGSNNIHFDSPPIMMDGRNFTTWQPSTKISEDTKTDLGFTSNWQYRKYATENATAIIRQNQINACDQCSSCPSIYGTQQEGPPITPFLYKSRVDKSTPPGYEDSDMKSLYLSKYALQCRQFTPVLTQEQLLNNGFQNYN